MLLGGPTGRTSGFNRAIRACSTAPASSPASPRRRRSIRPRRRRTPRYLSLRSLSTSRTESCRSRSSAADAAVRVRPARGDQPLRRARLRDVRERAPRAQAYPTHRPSIGIGSRDAGVRRAMIATRRQPPDTVVLIHGLWMTALSWEHWVYALRGEGLQGHRPELAGMEGDIDDLRADTSGSTPSGSRRSSSTTRASSASSTRRRSSWATRSAARSRRSCWTAAWARPASRSTRLR